ncbi:MAG: hypothetical protein ABFS34_10495 [Gemmatimonadota bacterium]
MSGLLILCPLPEEAAGVVARLTDRGVARIAGVEAAWRGRLGGRAALVCVTGDGPSRAGAGARASLGEGAGAVLVAGVGGGLAPGLDPGALIVATSILDEATGARADCASAAALAATLDAEAAPVVTALHVAATPGARERLRGAARPAPAVVDLESWALVAAARAAGRAWAVLRAISDAADESLPAYLEGCRDEGGSVRRAAVMRAALVRPWTLPALTGMRARVAACAAVLADACERVAASDWPAAAKDPGLARTDSIGFRE